MCTMAAPYYTFDTRNRSNPLSKTKKGTPACERQNKLCLGTRTKKPPMIVLGHKFTFAGKVREGLPQQQHVEDEMTKQEETRHCFNVRGTHHGA